MSSFASRGSIRSRGDEEELQSCESCEDTMWGAVWRP